VDSGVGDGAYNFLPVEEEVAEPASVTIVEPDDLETFDTRSTPDFAAERSRAQTASQRCGDSWQVGTF